MPFNTLTCVNRFNGWIAPRRRGDGNGGGRDRADRGRHLGGPAQRTQGNAGQLPEAAGEPESIAEDFEGVDKAYAIQAGRELRILVDNEKITGRGRQGSCEERREAHRERAEVPGRIKVTIIREMRVIEYAR